MGKGDGTRAREEESAWVRERWGERLKVVARNVMRALKGLFF